MLLNAGAVPGYAGVLSKNAASLDKNVINQLLISMCRAEKFNHCSEIDTARAREES
jgi:hypothetical protein